MIWLRPALAYPDTLIKGDGLDCASRTTEGWTPEQHSNELAVYGPRERRRRPTTHAKPRLPVLPFIIFSNHKLNETLCNTWAKTKNQPLKRFATKSRAQ